MLLALRSFVLVISLTIGSVANVPAISNPVLILTGTEPYTRNGKQLIRYHYQIFNAESFPAEIWLPSPTLPACGKNTNASRTWIDVYDQSGKRLNGFCALSATNFSHVWFAVEEGLVPPSWVYIEMTDRLTNTKYKSNLAETTL